VSDPKPAPEHDIGRTKAVERTWAAVLDAWLAPRYHLREATLSEQRQGVDRVAWLRHRPDPPEVRLEYKCDTVAVKTGNAFVETTSNVADERAGWLYSCKADWILYFVVPTLVLRLDPNRLRELAPGWIATCQTRRVYTPDPGYHTEGLLVPLRLLKVEAAAVYRRAEARPPVLSP